ncbi:phage holin family protein [Azospira restricta]|uniref:Phage holin family protein n=1 Tax=Azospira restricta TaxID=404405 RepID=A0A974Y4F1_9RHOO|nr:phage holin family protein [Azospira restricta]QRJ64474.1 phage holin family protein [Azospira restricta]
MSSTPGSGEAGGLFAALRTSAVTLVATARTRIELAGNELAGERIRLVRLLVLGIAALFCVGVGILLLVGLVVALAWEQRVLVLGGFAAAFLIAGGLLFAAMQRANDRHQVFAATLAELEEDLRQLRAATGHGKKAD